MSKVIFDTETGVIERELKAGDRIISNEQAEAYREIQERKQSRGKSFTFGDMDSIREIKEDVRMAKELKDKTALSCIELGYLLVLQTYTNFDGILYESSQAMKPMNRVSIGRVLGIKKSNTVTQLVDKLLENELLIEVEEPLENGKTAKGFKVNEKYHFKGKSKNRNVVKVFSTKVREAYGELKPADLGLLYMILPYISYETNVLCHNPYEQDARKIEAMSIDDLVKITGYSLAELKRKITNMKFGEYTVFSKTTKNRKVHFTVNPLVFYRKEGEAPQALVNTFLIQGR